MLLVKKKMRIEFRREKNERKKKEEKKDMGGENKENEREKGR